MARTWIGLAALLLGVLTGCTSVAVGSASSGSGLTSSTASGGVEPTGVPALEGPPRAPVQPQAPEVRPSVDVPTMPVGPGDYENEGAAGTHCVSLRYLDDDHPIPRGVQVVWDRPRLTSDASAYFEPGGFSCRGGALCAGYAWTTGNQNGQCWVPVRETGDWSGNDQDAAFTAGGRLVCPVGGQALCEHFRSQIRVNNSIAWVTVQSTRKSTTVVPTEPVTTEPTVGPTEAPAN
jgi:hypothetical protein